VTTKINLRSASVLITGGSEGIGLGLAVRFLGAGSAVLVTGRSREKLDRVAHDNPGLRVFGTDIGVAEEREALAEYIRREHPGLNILINNAGVQRRVSLAADNAPWSERQKEIDILLSGPVHLNHLLVPIMLSHGRPGIIVDVTSGGAYLPQPFAPVYSACKAAVHSYTVNLRFALAGTSCRVVEVIPPAVRTALAGAGATHGAPLDDFCDAIFAGLAEGAAEEIGYGMTATEAFEAPKALYRAMFKEFSTRFPVKTYGPRRNAYD
jgi:uncharacterized oxidoreductase